MSFDDRQVRRASVTPQNRIETEEVVVSAVDGWSQTPGRRGDGVVAAFVSYASASASARAISVGGSDDGAASSTASKFNGTFGGGRAG